MKDILSSFAATALIQLANVGSSILLARILLPDGRGELAAIMLWPMVITALGMVGLPEAVAYLAARRRVEPSAILRASLVVGTALSLILLPVAAVIVEIVFARKNDDVMYASTLFLAFIPLHIFSLAVIGMFQGRQNFGVWNVFRTLVHLLYLGLIPIFALAGFGTVGGFALAFLISMGGTLASAVAMAWRAGWFAPPADRARSSLLGNARDLIRYGVQAHYGTAVSVIAERLDQLIISIMFSAADLGLYVVATTAARLPLVIASTLATVAFPKIAAAATREEQALIFGRSMRMTALAILPASLMLAAIIPWLLPFFFGAAFSSATWIAWVLILSLVPLSFKTIISAGLKACNCGFVVGQAEMIALVVSSVMLALLIPAYGLLGAAAVSVLAQSSAMVFLLMRATKEFGMPLRDFLIPRISDFDVVWAKWR